MSADNGSNWTTLEVDSNYTYKLIDNSLYAYGTTYKIRILASDGINTGQTTSDEFTIIPPPSIGAGPFTELDSLEGHKLIEGEITNDGGRELNSTGWNIETGLLNVGNDQNITLAQNERLYILFEENYSRGGLMNITFLALDANALVNDTYSTTIFVGDLRAGNISQLYTNSTQRAFEFKVWSADVTNLTNVNWTFDTGALNLTCILYANITHNESLFIIVANNYSDTGPYAATASAEDWFNSYSEGITFTIPDITIQQFGASQQDELVTYNFTLVNELLYPITASWQLDTGRSIENGSVALQPGQQANISVPVTFTSYGDFNSVLNASDGTHSHTASTAVSVKELLLGAIQKLSLSGTTAIFEFTAKDQFSTNKALGWRFETNSSNITSSETVTLVPHENITVLIEYNFTTNGSYAVSAWMNTTVANYTQNTTIITG